MNNILAHYYQITFLNENDGGWLGKKLNIENNIKQARENTDNFNSFSYQQKLYFFVDLLDKIGPEKSMAYVHSKYREYIKQGVSYNASDMYSKSFSEISVYNVIPYMNSWKIEPSEDIQAEIYEQELPMLYYLRDFVESDEKSEKIRTDLNLEGNYSLVNNDELAKYGMKGNLSLTISIDDFSQIEGKKIYIKNGKNIVKEIEINNKDIEVKDLPVGIYTLQIPNTRTDAYKYSYQYVIIKENSNENKEIQYQKMQINSLASDTEIQFKGLGDSLFAKATLDLENKEIRVKSNNQSSHVYFTDEYANIQIFDKDGKQVYEKSYIGNVNNPGDDIIPIDLGYTIKIKHREPGRLVFQSQMLNQKEEFANTNTNQTTYTVTKYGLQKEGTSDNEQYEMFKRKIEQYISKLKNQIPKEKQSNKNNYFIQKNKLFSAILALNEEDKNQFLEATKFLGLGVEEKLYLSSEKYKIDSDYISKVEKETKLVDYINNFETNGKIEVIKDNGTQLKDNEYVGTGMTMIITKDNEKITKKIAVSGDLSGDGKISITDLSTINHVLLNLLTLENEYKIAADLDENGKISITDLSTINKMVLKIL